MQYWIALRQLSEDSDLQNIPEFSSNATAFRFMDFLKSRQPEQ